MSFTLGGVNTDSLAGVTAILQEWPSLGGLSVDSTDIPGRDGRFFGGVTRNVSRFSFDVFIEGQSPAETLERRAAFLGLLDPSRGPRSLVLDVDTGWKWPEVLASDSIEWGRFTWARGIGYTLRATVVLETQGEPSAREVDPLEVAVAPTAEFTMATGNTSAYPRVVFPAESSKGDAAWVVKVGGFSIEVEAGFAAGHSVELDWAQMMFSELDGAGDRVRSLVPRMSRFDRPVLSPGESVTVSVTPAPTGGARFFPNVRRI